MAAVARTSAMALALWSASAWGAQGVCHEERGTMKKLCVDVSAVRVNGDTRAAPLWSGGPSGMRKTGYTFVANCAKGISTLQDAQGVNFAGSFSGDTGATRVLSEAICEAPKPRKDPKLRQF